MACSAGTGVARRRRSRASGLLGRIRRTTAAGTVAADAPTAGASRAASTAYGLRTPPVFAPAKAASACGVQPAFSAAVTAGASLARWAAVNRQSAPSAAKNSLAGPSPPAPPAAGSRDGSLYGSGATAAPRDCARCTPSARWLHPVPSSGCNGCTPPGPLSTATLPVPTGCGGCTPSARPAPPGSASAASLMPSPGN